MKFTTVVATSVACMLSAMTGAIAAPILDQFSTPALRGGVAISTNNALTGTHFLDQFFTAGLTGKLTEIDVALSSQPTDIVPGLFGTLTLSVHNVVGGVISTASLGSVNLLASSLPSHNGINPYHAFDLTAFNIDVSTGSQYAFELTHDGSAWVLADFGAFYSGGDLFGTHNGTVSGGLGSAYFRTFVDPAKIPEPVTLSLFGVGVAGAFAARHRKKQA